MLSPVYTSRVYSSGAHFQRVLQLVSNEVMLKARDIVGENLMEQPEMVRMSHYHFWCHSF